MGSGFDAKEVPMTSVVSAEWQPNKISNNASDPATKLGGFVLHDRTDAIQQTTMMFNYARMLDLGLDNYLYLGLNAGAEFYSVNQERLVALHPDDATLIESFGSKIQPEFSVGAFYRYDEAFYIGASLPQLFGLWFDRPKGRERELLAPPGIEPLAHFYGMAGVYLTPSDDAEILLIEPSIWVRGTRGVSYLTFSDKNRFPLSFDLNVRAMVQNQFWLGVGYNSAQLVNLDFAVEKILTKGLNRHAENEDRLRIGLNYAFPMGWRTPPFGHSFELTLSYAFWGFGN